MILSLLFAGCLGGPEPTPSVQPTKIVYVDRPVPTEAVIPRMVEEPKKFVEVITKACVESDGPNENYQAAEPSLQFLLRSGTIKESKHISVVRGAIAGDVGDIETIVRSLERPKAKTCRKCPKIPKKKKVKKISKAPEMRGVRVPRPEISSKKFSVMSPESRETLMTEYSIDLINALKKANNRLDTANAWRKLNKIH